MIKEQKNVLCLFNRIRWYLIARFRTVATSGTKYHNMVIGTGCHIVKQIGDEKYGERRKYNKGNKRKN